MEEGTLLDVHAHFSPPQPAAAAVAQWEAARREHFLAHDPWTWTVQDTLDYMDATDTAMQMLSNVPRSLSALHESNDYGAGLVARLPHRFGLLAALPTDDTPAACAELRRHPDADGWAVTCGYGGRDLADPALDPLWRDVDALGGVVFVHPDASASSVAELPRPLVEVAFDTGRTVVEMLYAGVFTRFPRIQWVFAHCGGTFPVLAGRLSVIGAEDWVPNADGLTREQIAATLSRLWVDTAASANPQQLHAARQTVGEAHVVYGSDWGVPCTNLASAQRNLDGVPDAAKTAARHLFPRAWARTGRP